MSRFEQIEQLARDAMEELGVPGASLGVLADGEEEIAGLGVTSLENPLDVTPETLFQIGSITKTFVAVAVLRLVERGALGLDEPVRAYLSELRLAEEDVATRVTTRHLLTHTGGWVGDLFEDTGAGEDALAQIVGRVAGLEQLTPLGEMWSYNNAGFYLAGRVIEVVSGRPFETAMRELVLEPLGLESSFFFPDDVMTRRFAVGHVLDEQEQTLVARPWWIGRAAHAAGGIVCGVRELLRYAGLYLDEQQLLSQKSLELLQQPHVPVGGVEDSVGLAWMLRERDGVRLISHGGGTKGQISWLCIAPARGFAFACLTNHQYGGALIERLTNPVLESYLGIREPELESVDVAAAGLREYVGRYSSFMSDAELSAADGGLELRVIPTRGFPTPDDPVAPPPPPAQLRFYDRDWAFVPEGLWRGIRVGFLRDDGGRIAWMRLGGRIYRPERPA